jgi:hypothetical protein
MANTLVFHKTLSIADFKSQNNNNAIEIIKNPKTEKLFFVCGSITGAATDSYKESPCMSLVSSEEEPDTQFWLLHKKSAGNTVDTL